MCQPPYNITSSRKLIKERYGTRLRWIDGVLGDTKDSKHIVLEGFHSTEFGVGGKHLVFHAINY